jgi:hypothetical protein
MVARRIGVLALTMMVALVPPLPAQQRPLALGQWVRTVSSADGAVHQGRLIFVVADTVVLDDGHRIAQRVDYVALNGHARLEIPRRIRSHPLAGALVGTGVGMAIGVFSYNARAIFSCADLACPPPTGQIFGRNGRVVLGGLVGLAIGALVGGHVYTTLWDPVPPDQVDRLRITVVPQPGGRLGLDASLRF